MTLQQITDTLIEGISFGLECSLETATILLVRALREDSVVFAIGRAVRKRHSLN